MEGKLGAAEQEGCSMRTEWINGSFFRKNIRQDTITLGIRHVDAFASFVCYYDSKARRKSIKQSVWYHTMIEYAILKKACGIVMIKEA